MKTMEYPRRPAPPLARVRQALSGEHIADVRGETRRRMLAAGLGDRIAPGARVAVTAGSRGTRDALELLGGVVDAVRACGGEPFLIPAMGSHGGATVEGQTGILRRLGITEETIGAPIRATMEAIPLGVSETGAVAHLDRIVSEADGVIILGRVKTHPESTSGLASGLLKMTTVGLGKQAGAAQAHGHGLWESVRAVPKITMAHAKILMGVAVVESALQRAIEIAVAPPAYEAFLETDTRLLEIARQHFARLPFDHLDLLIVDEIGKDIIGSGMDPNVIGMWRVDGGPKRPNYHRIVALSLTPASLGNGIGVGLADFTTRRLMDAYDELMVWVNLLTASEPGSTALIEGKAPLALETDREAIEVALWSALAGDAPRVCRIRNTNDLETFDVSEALLDEVRRSPGLTVETDPKPLPYDAAGNLL